MKKLIAMLLCLAMLATLSACGNTPATDTNPPSTEVQAEGKAVTMPAVVGMDSGYIMGYNENGIYTFRGVPYANHERFKYATPIASYGSEERPTSALTNGSVSPQSNTQTAYSNWAAAAAFMTPSESDMFSTESQCLNLNIWTNSLDENANKPVLVFMHGGGLQNGSSLELKIYDGKYFAESTDVVFVSVNARLNYVGYLDLTAIGGDANVGVADMVMSLEWVRDNIAKFGGDPNNVTILGQSGGGTKVTALASAPAAQGLFSKVVYVSGGEASGWTPDEANANAATLVDYIKANVPEMANASNEEIFAYLQTTSYDNLVAICGAARVGYDLTTESPYFQSNFYTEDGYLNDIAKQYSYMVGCAWAEMGGGTSDTAVLGPDWAGPMPAAAACNITAERAEEILKEKLGDRFDQAKALFEQAYPGHDLYDLNSLNSAAGMRLSERAAASGAPAVYDYFVAYKMPYFGGTCMVHTADLAFWFNSLDNVQYQINGDEENAYAVARSMSSALAAFCATGDPSTADLVWEPYTTDAPRTMVFDVESVCKDTTFDDELMNLLWAE